MKSNKTQILLLLNSLLIILFVSLVAIHIYYAFAIHINTLPFLLSRIGVFFAFIAIFSNKNKITWFLGIFLSLYGLCEIILIGNSEFNPPIMDFTSPLSVLLQHSNHFIKLLISVFPVLFYVSLIITFSVPSVRYRYGFTPPRIKSKKGYL